MASRRRADEGHRLEALAGAAASSVLIVCSSPGGPTLWLGPVALVPYFAVRSESSASLGLAGAGLVAGCWSGPILAAMVVRSAFSGLLLALGASLLLWACLTLSSRFATTGPMRLATFACLWPGAGGALAMLGSPIRGRPLLAGLGLEAPQLWNLVEAGGWPLLDAAVLAGVALFWMTLRGHGRARAHSAIAVALLGVAAVVVPAAECPATEATRIAAVQPRTPWTTLRRVGNSAYDRATVWENLLALTRQALAQRPDLVVWPENGAGLPIPQLRSRAAELTARLANSRTELLASGPEISQHGSTPTAWLFSAEGLRASVHKQRHVELVETFENELLEGPVVVTNGPPIGVVTCYDAVDDRIVADAVDAGAEILVSPTDNASFEATTLSAWQTAVSALLAIERGRSLLVVASYGPTLLVDPARRRVDVIVEEGSRGVATIEVIGHGGATLAARGGRVVVLIVLVLAAALLLRPGWGPLDLDVPRKSRRFLLGASVWATGATSGATSSVLLSSGADGLARILAERAEDERIDGMGSINPALRQSDPEGCGPAALSWVLFGLGDTVYEHELRRHRGRHSLAELSEAAADRGFLATPFEAGTNALRSHANLAYVLLVGSEHFIGVRVLEDGMLSVFDPLRGAVRLMPIEEFATIWSGYGLSVRLPSPRLHRR